MTINFVAYYPFSVCTKKELLYANTENKEIAKYYDLDFESEKFQYLQGEIGKRLFTVARRFLCDHCRVNFINYGKIKMKFS